ncbi:MAG: hypothetical protein RBR84_01805 [Bacteroidales bacterium]|nr:hypothetical protein [Bacteroidales bacterium]MDD4087199.1 hypothetical protein [Bacteroidales bacterium]MDY0084628.1 hypothetical protein [Bacteroidales bacterium]
MKHIYLFLITLMITSSALAQTETLAKWTFPSSDVADTLAEEANEFNQDAYLSTMGGTGAIEMKNGETSKAAQCNGWDNGNDTKAWYIQISTEGHKNITVSSKQQSGNNDPGPTDFKLQYRTVTIRDWVDIENADITVLNDWTSSALFEIPLPEACENQEVLFIRWVLTSNLDINGVELVESGKTKIDDIEIKGEVYTSLDQIGAEKSPVKIHYTADNQINFNSSILIKNVIQYDLSGKMLNEKMLSSFTGSFSCKQKQGISILVFQDYSGNRYAKKVMIQ